MTADHMRRAIMDACRAYESGDRRALETCIAEDFSYTSPSGDLSGRDAWFEHRWPSHAAVRSLKVERIFIEGNAAYVTCVLTTQDGRSVNITEYMTFNGGKIASTRVFLGPEYRDGRLVARDAADEPPSWRISPQC